jgi:acetyl-CoA carboxylase/biotin carboxylase 1
MGTFGTEEDRLFDLASKYARKLGIPRLYFSANSGARIGLATEVQAKFRIAWVDDEPTKGFEYIYLNAAEHAELKDSVITTKVTTAKGETRYKITDIVGRTHGLGVENLSGSGKIAGETSKAYEDIFTLTYITGRSVGIGAYLARLGQRCIQKDSETILLTGYQALNKLLGRAVYSSNLQLGGTDIMYTNGVTHLTVRTDLEGMTACIEWLNYVPKCRGGALPVHPKLTDPVDRRIAFSPGNSPYDCRDLLAGVTTGDKWTSGFFDQGSFMELLGGWAKTVVAGRARLGGLPVGVVAVGTCTVEQISPADPANPESKEMVLQKAGQVWYPDSAFKTAQAIEDMIAEDLPLFIFANWRGFSGGQQDMFDEILKYGSYIVDKLRIYKQPVHTHIHAHSYTHIYTRTSRRDIETHRNINVHTNNRTHIHTQTHTHTNTHRSSSTSLPWARSAAAPGWWWTPRSTSSTWRCTPPRLHAPVCWRLRASSPSSSAATRSSSPCIATTLRWSPLMPS